MTTVGTISLQLVEIPADFAAVSIRVRIRLRIRVRIRDRIRVRMALALTLNPIPGPTQADSGGAYAVYVLIGLAVLCKLGLLGYLILHR